MKAAELASAPVILISDSLDSLPLTYMLNLSARKEKWLKGFEHVSYKDVEEGIVEDIGIPQKFFEVGIDRVEKGYVKI